MSTLSIAEKMELLQTEIAAIRAKINQKDGYTHDETPGLKGVATEVSKMYAGEDGFVLYQKTTGQNRCVLQWKHGATIPAYLCYRGAPTTAYITGSNCYDVQSSIPITTIGAYAFCKCNMWDDTILQSVRTIGDYALYGVNFHNQNITIGNRLETIGLYAFSNCNAYSITFQSTPTSIDGHAFTNCWSLTDIYVPWSEDEVENAPWGATNAEIHYDYTP